VNKKINPKVHSTEDLFKLLKVEPLIVDNHLKTFTPVGTAITIVAAVK